MHYSLLADVIVVVHLAYACFVLFGLIGIVVGAWCGWTWIRNFPLRITHLVCTLFVPLETILRMTCPLTTLENYFLRASGTAGYNRSFIGNLVSEILFYDFPEWVFAVMYMVMGTVAVVYFVRVPPSRPVRSNL